MKNHITTRIKAFGTLATYHISIDVDGTIRVYDSVAGYYTTCHGLSLSVQRRLRKLAQVPSPARK